LPASTRKKIEAALERLISTLDGLDPDLILKRTILAAATSSTSRMMISNRPTESLRLPPPEVKRVEGSSLFAIYRFASIRLT
jgi:hypothetical protein